MMIRFKIDQDTTESLDRITRIYNFKRDSITLRIGLALSIKSGKRFDERNDTFPQNGREYSPTSNVFGRLVNASDNYPIYKSVMDNHYQESLNELKLTKLIKLHLKDGLAMWEKNLDSSSISNGDHIKFLIKQVRGGLSLRKTQFLVNANPSKSIKSSEILEFNGSISFELGRYLDHSIVKIDINDETQWSSRNIAIAGQNGSGKSQLVLDILYQLSKNSNQQLPFTFFDFKGTDTKDSLDKFLKSTKCEFLKVEHNKGFPFSPLSRIDINNQNNILAFANDFQTFFPEIKQVQSASLIRTIQEFINDIGRAPNLVELMETILERNNEKDNTTTSVLQQLISSGIYDEDEDYDVFNRSTYVSMPSDVNKQIKQFVIFNKLKYMFNVLKSVGNTTVVNNIKGLRHIIVIDEAQNFLQKKTARPIIEDMLRELRSIGVIVVLIAQETNDFAYPDFDFISQVRLSICADVNDKSAKRMVKFLGTVNSEIVLEQQIKKYSLIEQDEIGEPIKKAIINLSEPKAIAMRQFWKTAISDKL